MANPFYHAVSSANRFGGKWEDYHAVHSWFDESKSMMADNRHRALRHHTEGLFLAEKLFGPVIRNSAGRDIPTRFLGEQHMIEDLGWIPSMQDWFKHLQIQPWMIRGRKLSHELPSA